MTKTATAMAIALLLVSTALAGAPKNEAPAEGAKSANEPRRASGPTSGAEWEILFPDEISVEEYARQIDYFKIEIAAVSKSGKIEYIAKVGQRKPDKRIGNRASEYRPYVTWRKGTLHAADRKLLAKAGIGSEGKELWHFFPTETEVLLATLERAYGKRDPGEIKRTRFEVRPKTKGGGYEFVVVEQDPPRATESKESPSTSANAPVKN